MEVKILAALGNEQGLELLHIGLAQIALLPVKEVGPGRGLRLQGGAETVVGGVFRGFLFRCHRDYPFLIACVESR